jgi:hypothetical protein
MGNVGHYCSSSAVVDVQLLFWSRMDISTEDQVVGQQLHLPLTAFQQDQKPFSKTICNYGKILPIRKVRFIRDAHIS